MAHARVEEVRILFLNAKNMLIANEALWQGSVDEASVHVREVIARAIALGATALIIVHNHPSGDPAPSQQDIATGNVLLAVENVSLAFGGVKAVAGVSFDIRKGEIRAIMIDPVDGVTVTALTSEGPAR